MNIGRLDRRIVIQTKTSTNINGEAVESWATLDTVWATVKFPVSSIAANEGTEAGRETATTQVEFTIRYRTDVTESMRVYYQTQYYDIQRINQIGRNEMLKLVTVKKS